MDVALMVLIALGLAFDVFAISISQGSVLGEVKARGLIFMCLIVVAFQGLAVLLGTVTIRPIHIENMSAEVQKTWRILAAAIFLAEGGIKIFLVYYKKSIPEIKSDIDLKKITGIAAATAIYTYFAAAACKIMQFNMIWTWAAIGVATVALVIVGVYVGYRNGELRKEIFRGGGGLLIIVSILIVLQYILGLFN